MGPVGLFRIVGLVGLVGLVGIVGLVGLVDIVGNHDNQDNQDNRVMEVRLAHLWVDFRVIVCGVAVMSFIEIRKLKNVSDLREDIN